MAQRRTPTYNREESPADRKPTAGTWRTTPPPVRSYADLTPTVRRVDVSSFRAARPSVSGRCGHRRLDYRPYSPEGPRGPRTFTACPACGHAAKV